MLEHYFVRPDTIDRIRASWIAEPIERYVAWLTEGGYRPRNVHSRVPILLRFGEFAAAHGAIGWDELPAFVEEFVQGWVRERRPDASPDRTKHYANEIRNPIHQMLRLVVAGFVGTSRRRILGASFHDRVPGFFDYLREERGLREETVRLYDYHLTRFEQYLATIGLDDLAAISPVVLSGFVAERSTQLGKTAVRDLCGTLRVFVRYLYREQVLSRDLSSTIESPRRYRLSDLPRSISWDDVRRMLDAVDRRTDCGRRDYAILLLLVTYGLRAREIASLTLEDFDWRAERLRVSERKAGHSTVFPLSPVVGDAVLHYLKHGRPETGDRHLFFRILAPPRPLTHAAVSSRASHYLHKAGCEVPRPGSHTLRHTCVQRLVDAGFAWKSIGDYVGHRSAASTAVYGKVAVEQLREVALGIGEDVL
jgi:site-specific recombinase XerD